MSIISLPKKIIERFIEAVPFLWKNFLQYTMLAGNDWVFPLIMTFSSDHSLIPRAEVCMVGQNVTMGAKYASNLIGMDGHKDRTTFSLLKAVASGQD